MAAATESHRARTSTLTSLAILKVNMDQRRDYLDYLRPFVLQALSEQQMERITDHTVAQKIEDDFGLFIPQRTIQLVLKRLSRSHLISREAGAYRIAAKLPDSNLLARQAEAQRHIEAILLSLQEFSTSSLQPLKDTQEAVDAVTAFLAEFDVSCLRAYLRGTVLPPLQGSHPRAVVLVSDFVRNIQQTSHELFRSFVVLVQGHMLANALLCPDLEHVSQDYRNVTFYLDTPILVQRLGLEGGAKLQAGRDLLELLTRLKARLAVFEHSRDELRGVILGAADHLESPNGRGSIVVEARRNGTTRSDLVLLAEAVEDRLNRVGIETHRAPLYRPEFQIDEGLFEDVLDDWVGYRNPRAKLYDINSVRSIYALRERGQVPSLERARAVLVTSNGSLAKAAWRYGQQYESSHDVSSVITDFTLANAAWLKAPLGAPTIPTTRLLSFAYAALEPSSDMLDKYMTEIDRLESAGTMGPRDLEILRSSPSVYPELMGYTLGDEAAVTPDSITRTLRRVSSEIKAEELDKLHREQEAHRETQQALFAEQQQRTGLLKNLYWRCDRTARRLAWGVSIGSAVVVTALLGAGLFAEMGFIALSGTSAWALVGVSAVLTVLTYLNIVLGLNVRGLHGQIQRRILRWLLAREARAIGVDFEETTK